MCQDRLIKDTEIKMHKYREEDIMNAEQLNEKWMQFKGGNSKRNMAIYR
jgi:hypothetical protein